MKIATALTLALTTSSFAQDEAAVLFKARCADCHGSKGAGNTIAARKMSIPDLRSSRVQKLSDVELFERIAHGKRHRKYPHVFSDLGVSDAQVRQLVNYIRTLAPRHNQ